MLAAGLADNNGPVHVGMKHWTVLSTVCFVVSTAIAPFWPMCKQTWSPSYLFMTAGSCGYLLVLLYLLFDYPCQPPAWQRRLRASLEPARW